MSLLTIGLNFNMPITTSPIRHAVINLDGALVIMDSSLVGDKCGFVKPLYVVSLLNKIIHV
jgi:hypothetical protein